jgi:hypothetical protein
MEQPLSLQGPAASEPSSVSPPGGPAWLLSGLVLPLGSRNFYRWAVRKPIGFAILFFLVLTSLVTVVTTVVLARALVGAGDAIQRAYAEGEVPDIVIRNGIAEVDAPQPHFFFNARLPRGEGILLATDTSGRLKEIDSSLYAQGFLLTRTELHVLNAQGRYQTIPLFQLNEVFSQDVLVLDADAVARGWRTVSPIAVIGSGSAIFFWHFVVGPFLLAGLALLIWGVASLVRRGTTYGEALIIGVYAWVPAFFLAHLMRRSGVGFAGLQTALLLLFWAAAMYLALAPAKPLGQESARLGTAWLGAPFLVMLLVDVFVELPDPAGLIALWGLFVLTIMMIVFVRQRLRSVPPAHP